MTYTEYKEELLVLKEIEADLTFAFDYLTEEFLRGVTIAEAVRKDRRWRQIREDLRQVRSYRARLSRWFSGSRIGNPPTLRPSTLNGDRFSF